MLWGFGSPGVWSELDLLLVKALRLFEDGLCSCGNPLSHTSDLVNTMAWEYQDVTCAACQILENKAKQDTDSKPGLKRYITNKMSELFG